MTKKEVITKIYQVNSLLSEILEYVNESKLINAEVFKESSWMKLGFANRIWDSSFDEYEYNMKGEVRRNGVERKLNNGRFNASIKGKLYHIYMPKGRSIRIKDPNNPNSRELIANTVIEASELLGISKYTIARALDRGDTVKDSDGIIYSLQKWYPQPYIIGDKKRKDLNNNEKI